MQFVEKKIKHIENLLAEVDQVAMEYVEQGVIQVLKNSKRLTGFTMGNGAYFFEVGRTPLEVDELKNKGAQAVITFVNEFDSYLKLSGGYMHIFKNDNGVITVSK